MTEISSLDSQKSKYSIASIKSILAWKDISPTLFCYQQMKRKLTVNSKAGQDQFFDDRLGTKCCDWAAFSESLRIGLFGDGEREYTSEPIIGDQFQCVQSIASQMLDFCVPEPECNLQIWT